jgi:hypothetical protein
VAATEGLAITVAAAAFPFCAATAAAAAVAEVAVWGSAPAPDIEERSAFGEWGWWCEDDEGDGDDIVG